MIQRTLCLIKPDAVRRNIIGEILAIIQRNNLRVIGLKFLVLSPSEAAGFYALHREKAFFKSLVEYMCSGPIVVVALQGESAISKYRQIMGTTNPEKAEEGTLRKLFAESLEANAVHGSDSEESALYELGYFFSEIELQV